nr:hypothetical protein [uncultured Blautia sp.]
MREDGKILRPLKKLKQRKKELLAELSGCNSHVAQIALNSPYDLKYGKQISFQMELHEYSRRAVASAKKYFREEIRE